MGTTEVTKGLERQKIRSGAKQENQIDQNQKTRRQ
jgi:hypothetical protein